MKCMLVTGGCGFIGSNFVNFAYDHFPGYRIINLDAMKYCARVTNVREEVRSDAARYRLVRGSVAGTALLKEIYRTEAVELVIHFAAETHVDNSFVRPLDFTTENIVGTHALLEATRLHNTSLRTFVLFSTDEVYGESRLSDDDSRKKRESDAMAPTNPYSASKAAAELIAMSYFKSFKFPVVIARGNNVFGPNQYGEKVIPKFASLIAAGKTLTIHGSGRNTRSFIHVSDVCTAVKTIVERGVHGEAYNIGSSRNEVSILDLARAIVRIVKGDAENADDWIEHVQDRPHNDERYHICTEKLASIGWATQDSSSQDSDNFQKQLADTVWQTIETGNHHTTIH